MLAVLSFACLSPAARAASPFDEPKTFDVPAGNAVDTLKRAALQAGLEIVYSAETVRDVKTNAISGQYSPRDALSRMLEGTDLYVVQDDRTGAMSVLRRNRPKVAARDSSDVERPGDRVVHLSPFEVNSSRDTGYEATSSVSGTRLNTPLVELSKNILVLTRDFIDDQQVTELSHAFDYTAEVVGGQADSGIMTIRGFGGNSPKRNGLGIYGGDESLYDTATIDRVEVVKGPSALLYGTSSPGGVINYITKQPLATTQSSLRLLSASWDRYRAELDTGGPLVGDGDVVNHRMVLAYDTSHNFFAYWKQRRAVLSETVRWFLSPNTYITVGGEDNIVRGTALRPYSGVIDRAIYNPDGTVTYNAYFDLTRYKYLAATPYTVQDTDVHRFDVDFSHNFTDTLNFFVHYNYLSNNLFNVGELALSEGQQAGGPTFVPTGQYEFQFPVYLRLPHRTTNNLTATLKDEFQNSWMKVELVAGLEYFHYGLTFESYQPYKWPVMNFVTGAGYETPILNTVDAVRQAVIDGTWQFQFKYFETQDYTAPFALAHFHFFDNRVRLILGVRHDDIRDGQTFYAADSTPAHPFGLAAPSFVRYDTAATTPLFGLSVTPFASQPGFTVYANYSKSLQSNEVVNQFTGKGLPPQTGKGVEAGAKFDLTGKLFLQLGIYQTDKSGVPEVQPGHLPGDFVAGGLQRSKGGDLDLFYSPLRGLQIMGGLAITDATYVTDSNPSLEGTKLMFVPDWRFTLWTKYTLQESSLRGLSIGGGVVSSADSVFQYPYGLHYPGYTKFDLLFGYTYHLPHNRVDFEVKINNVTDKRYITNQEGLGDPFSWQASVTYHF